MGQSYLDAIRAQASRRCLAREGLKAQLRAAYDSETRQLAMLVGVGGVGKTTLANWLAAHVRAQGGAIAWVSGEQIGPNPEAFMGGLRISSDDAVAPDLQTIGRRHARDLVVVDSLERLRSLLPWIVQDFLAQIGDNALVLFASREHLSVRERTELGINDVFVEWPVKTMSSSDAAQMASALGVAEPQRAAVVAAARGLPLALRLLSERPDSAGATGFGPDVLAALVDAFVSRAPSQTHVLGIYLAAIARHVDEAMMAAICELDGESIERARMVFDWLGQTSIVERTELGISTHALVREVVFAHLLQRNPELLERIQARILDVLVTRMVSTDMTSAHELLLQALYVRRNSPIVKDQFPLTDDLERCEVVTIGAHNIAQVRALIQQFEGADSVASFDRWIGASDTHALAIVDGGGKVRSFKVVCRITKDTPEVGFDPLLRTAWDLWCAREAPGEPRALDVFRWFIEAESHQRFTSAMTALQTLGPVIMMPRHDNLAVCCITTPPEQWAPYVRSFQLDMSLEHVQYVGMRWAFSFMDAEHLREAFAASGAPVWNALRTYVHTLVGFAMPAPVVAKGTDTISRETFGHLLRRALNHLDEPQTLRDPEMASLVGAASEELDRAVSSLIAMGIKRLADKPGTARHAEILDVTYVRPTVKQHAAAVELGLPYGTYRYQLRKAVAVLEDELWHIRVGATGN